VTPKQASDWRDPLNKFIWQRAFKERATEMTLRDGSVFTIRYDRRFPMGDEAAKAEGKKIDYAWVQGKHSIGSPCGWFKVKDVLKNA